MKQAIGAALGALVIFWVAGRSGHFETSLVELGEWGRAVGLPGPAITILVYLSLAGILAVGAGVGWTLAQPNPGPLRKGLWWAFLILFAVIVAQDLLHRFGQ